jgi:hypothetical protein
MKLQLESMRPIHHHLSMPALSDKGYLQKRRGWVTLLFAAAAAAFQFTVSMPTLNIMHVEDNVLALPSWRIEYIQK